MHTTAILISLLCVAGFFQPLAAAQIPFGVSATKVVVEGSIDLSDLTGYEYVNGLPGFRYKDGHMDGSPFDGLWDDIDIDRMDYTLTFWNVGREGERVGMLFWREAYAEATLTIEHIAATAGKIWRKAEYKDDDGQTYETWNFEPSPNWPEFTPIVYHLEFSGTPFGTFTEKAPYISEVGKPLTARFTARGEKVIFSVPGVTMADRAANGGKNPNPIAVSRLEDISPAVPGNPWYGWDLDTKGECGGDSGARFNWFDGMVEVMPDADLEDSRPAEMGDVLQICDHVKTYEDSEAEISFADMATYYMKENSEIILNTPPVTNSKMQLVIGQILTNVRKMAKDGSMDVYMTQAVAGCKGTVFVCEDDGTTSSVKVLDGTIAFTSLASSDEAVLVTAGEMVFATAAGLSDKTAFDVDEELAGWDDYTFKPGDFELIEWDPADDPDGDIHAGSGDNIPGFELLFALAAFIVIIAKRRNAVA